MLSQRERVARAGGVYAKLRAAHSDAACALEHTSAFELLVAVVLSAQTTDVAVNRCMPPLMGRYPDPVSLARAQPTDVEPLLRVIGMYRQKARTIVALARRLVAQFDGQVPKTMGDLQTLPGVGRKTANVVLGGAFSIAEGIAVDTHVQRVSQRLGWTRHKTPAEIEQDLMLLLPKNEWIVASQVLIFHGRRICSARRPSCERCPVARGCPSAFHAEEVGRKER